MAPTTDVMPTTPLGYAGTFDLQDIDFIGHFSRVGSESHHIAFDDSMARYCRLHVDESFTTGKPDGHRLTASYSPKAPTVHFEVHEAGDPHQLFVSQKFWQRFAVENVY